MAEGLAYLHEISAETGLPVVTEVINPADVEWLPATADIVQIGPQYAELSVAERSGPAA